MGLKYISPLGGSIEDLRVQVGIGGGGKLENKRNYK